MSGFELAHLSKQRKRTEQGPIFEAIAGSAMQPTNGVWRRQCRLCSPSRLQLRGRESVSRLSVS